MRVPDLNINDIALFDGLIIDPSNARRDFNINRPCGLCLPLPGVDNLTIHRPTIAEPG